MFGEYNSACILGNKCKIRGLFIAGQAYGTDPEEKDGAVCWRISFSS